MTGTTVVPPVATSLVTVGELLSRGRLVPASVQRGFEWSPEDALKLLHDIEATFAQRLGVDDEDTSFEDPDDTESDEPLRADGADPIVTQRGVFEPDTLDGYFVGSLVLRDLGGGFREIYDGLQRTTTLTIIACVLRDLGAWDDLPDVFLDGSAPRLTLASRDETFRLHVQNPGATLRYRYVTAKRQIGKRIQRVKNELLNELDKWSPSRRQRFANYLCHHVLACQLMVPNPRTGRQIFVSTNLLGRKLDPIDILKGQIADAAAHEAQAAEFVALWNTVRDELGEHFRELLQMVDVLTRNNNDGLPHWPTELGAHLASLSPKRVGAWLMGLQHYGRAWLHLRWVFTTGGYTHEEGALHRLDWFSWHEWRPLALLWWERYQRAGGHQLGDAHRKRFRRLFERLHRRCMVILLAGYSAADRRKIFRSALAQSKGSTWKDPTVDSNALTFRRATKRKVARTLSDADPGRADLAPTHALARGRASPRRAATGVERRHRRPHPAAAAPSRGRSGRPGRCRALRCALLLARQPRGDSWWPGGGGGECALDREAGAVPGGGTGVPHGCRRVPP